MGKAPIEAVLRRKVMIDLYVDRIDAFGVAAIPEEVKVPRAVVGIRYVAHRGVWIKSEKLECLRAKVRAGLQVRYDISWEGCASARSQISLGITRLRIHDGGGELREIPHARLCGGHYGFKCLGERIPLS